ncbi:MAG TPA: anti-sigma factor [Candidatus Acidoferrum sp.]|nr:anti-sigma factor [Candidatus Acidoferrum sp.]
MKNCGQFRELFEVYALGALDPAERAALEAHLATGCQDCAKSIEEARWLVSQLAYLAPQAAPSDMLKGRMMQTVRAEAQAAKQSPSPKPAIPFWMWAAVAALLLITVYSAWNGQRLREEIRNTNERAAAIQQQRQELESQLEQAKREAVILTDPASVNVAFTSKDSQTPQLEAKWHSKLGIVLTGQKIPAPAGNRVLQLWLIPKAPGSKPTPSLTVRPDPDGKFVLLVSHPPELMEQTKALAITEEPAGGSPAPTTPPRWVGGVS